MTRDEIFDKIREVLVDALGVDEDEVTESARLTSDLGAESIDFLDITFKLEQAFGVKIPQGELFPDNAAQDPRFVQNGMVTPEGIAEMKKRLPHVDFAHFAKEPKLAQIGNLFTVGVLVRYVERKLGAAAAA
ncbi:MAG: acyl carrier protein [Planctomycetota bacterium]|nr:acyl carrier protein [Planctomycetota bacterium]